MKSIPLKVLPNYALIQLEKKYESGLISDREKYSTNSSGILLDYLIDLTDLPLSIKSLDITHSSELDTASVLDQLVNIYEDLKGKTVYFTPFEDGDIIKIEDTEYVFVPIKALRGGKV